MIGILYGVGVIISFIVITIMTTEKTQIGKYPTRESISRLPVMIVLFLALVFPFSVSVWLLKKFQEFIISLL